MSQPETTSERPPVSVRRRLLVGLAVVVAVLFVLGFVQYVRDGGGTAARLQRHMTELDESDPNWRLEDIERTRDTPPEGQNSARVIVHAVRLLPKDWGKRDLALDEKLRQPERPPPARLDAEQRELLEKTLAHGTAAVAEARKLADLPRGRHQLTWATNPIATRLEDQQKTRQAAALLWFDALRLAHQKDISGALRSCRGILHAGRSLGDEPFFISQMVRIGCVDEAGRAIERVLALGEAADADLARLQATLAEEDRHNTFLVGVRGERAWISDLYTKMEDRTIPHKEVRGFFDAELWEESSWRQRLLGFSKADLRYNHLQSLDLLTRAAELARLPEAESVDLVPRLNAVMASQPRGAILARVLTPALGKVAQGCQRKHAKVRNLLVLLAAERYRLKHGAWPDKPEVPMDPCDGKPIRYRRLADGVVAYAVGPDGKDDGGQVGRDPPGTRPLDEGYRLWDVKGRGQEKP